MLPSESAQQESPVGHYLVVLRRRKWIILLIAALGAIAAAAFSLQQEALYQSTAQVLLSEQNPAAGLSSTQAPTDNAQLADRNAHTQVGVARTPPVAERTLKALGKSPAGADEFLANSEVDAEANADLLNFMATSSDSSLAPQLANAYARQYTIYKRSLDTKTIERAKRSVHARVASLEKSGDTSSTLYRNFLSQEGTLAQMAALETANAYVVNEASDATKVQPRTLRNVALGLIVGIIVGVGIAVLWEALDTRVRSSEEIGEYLGGAALLARIPNLPKGTEGEREVMMLTAPAEANAEAFRVLRTNLEFARLNRSVKSIVISSAVQREGKSTTIANLAVAFAKAGQRVVLMDLDLRRPRIGGVFHVASPGVTQVALGKADLDEALVEIPVFDGQGPGGGNGARAASDGGSLQVLPAGPLPPEPAEFVGSVSLAQIHAALTERADLVLIDAPPMLGFSDGPTLSKLVDGIIIVTRMDAIRKPLLQELQRVCASLPTPVLGFAITGAGEAEKYGYGYGDDEGPEEEVGFEPVAASRQRT